MIVASTNDPYASFAYSHNCTKSWGSQLVSIGDAGHINGDSNLGIWPEGFRLLQTLL